MANRCTGRMTTQTTELASSNAQSFVGNRRFEGMTGDHVDYAS